MAPTISNVELLIGEATNPASRNEDPNVIQKICQAVVTEPLGMQTAIQLISHKMKSPQEWESMQSLLILQSCVNNCGKVFHSEVGKFRFLNEMIKIVSPNYLGSNRPVHIKKRICELLYTWTIDVPHEPKIADAYQMLKNQRIILDDPTYLGVSLPHENKTKIVFKDEEKSKHLQQLLQSKKPGDIQEANALIKKIVKDDERKQERSSRRSVEVETALNNGRVLEDMICNFEQSPGGKADLDLMSELYDSCSSIQTNIYRLVSDLHDKEDGIGELLRANDELSRVMGRYKVKIREGTSINNVTDAVAEQKLSDEETLLDLNPQAISNDVRKQENEHQPELNDITEKDEQIERKLDLISILDEPLSISRPLDSTAQATNSLESSFIPQLLIPERPYQAGCGDEEIVKATNSLQDIDLLGSSAIRQHLPANSPLLGAQFKTKEKVSLNQLKSKQIEAYQTRPVVNKNILSDVSSFHFTREKSELDSEGLSDVNDVRSSSNIENVLPDSFINQNQQIDTIIEEFTTIPTDHLQTSNNELGADRKLVPEPALQADCNNINDIEMMQLSDIIPDDSKSPMEIINKNLMKVSVHRTLNKPSDDTDVLVVTTSSSHPTPVSNYNLHIICPEGCSVQLLTPSSTKFSAFKPFLPSPAITQILIFTNPNQVTDDALRLILKYKVADKTQADYGEVDLAVS